MEEQTLAPETSQMPETPQSANEPSLPPVAPLGPPLDPSAKKSKPTLLIIITLIILVAIGVAAYFLLHKSKPINSVTISNSSHGLSASPTGSTLNGSTFLAAPKPLGDLDFFKNYSYFTSDEINASNVKYAQIGTTQKGIPIDVVYSNAGGDPTASLYYIALENTPDNYAILTKLSADLMPNVSEDSQNISSFTNSLNSNVTLDNSDTISAFNFPTTVTLSGQGYTLPSGITNSASFINGLSNISGIYGTSSTSLSDIKKIGESQGITFYKVTDQSTANYTVETIYGVIGGVYASPYVLVDPMVSANAPEIQWYNASTDSSQGALNTNTYSYAAAGCGDAYGYIVANNITSSDLTAVGTGDNNQTIYQLSSDSPLLKEYYSEYGGGQNLDSGQQNLTLSEYQNDHVILIAKNDVGEYVVYERNDFILGGCGKPVIYLYPQTTTNVSVKVGAVITKSEPTYTNDGWQNVTASPSGKLIYGGNTYNSLFWEGRGIGNYPSTNTGFIVARSDLVATIRSQLAQQGLNANEINDFMTFWQPKLPTTPYTRLTWFTTAQMNQLAPLDITPAPNTLIRVFLDFEGLNKPEKIQPETLSAPHRTGFTVVEWGGLLKDY